MFMVIGLLLHLEVDHIRLEVTEGPVYMTEEVCGWKAESDTKRDQWKIKNGRAGSMVRAGYICLRAHPESGKLDPDDVFGERR